MTRPLASAFRSEPAADLPDVGTDLLRHDANAAIRAGEATLPGNLIIVLC